PDGLNGWYITPVHIDIQPYDDTPGVTQAGYSLNDGETWQIYTLPLIFGQSGEYNLLVKSIDAAGNEEEAKRVIFNIDLEGPDITEMIPVGHAYGILDTIIPTAQISDIWSGVDPVTVQLWLDGQLIPEGSELE